MEHGHTIRYTLDGIAGLITLGALAQVLPPVAAGLSIIWVLIQIADWAWKKTRK